MSGFGVAGPLSSKLTQLTCGYQGQAANERRKTSAGASHARSRTRSLGSPAREIFPRSWDSSLPTSLDGEEMPKLPNLPKRKGCRRSIGSCNTGVERTSLNYGKVRREDGKIETRHQKSNVLQEERSLQWDTNFARYRRKPLLSASSTRLWAGR
jgi:hypothetical protein